MAKQSGQTGESLKEMSETYRDLINLAVETVSRLEASTSQPIRRVHASLNGVGAVEVEFGAPTDISPEIRTAVAQYSDKNARVRKAQDLIALAKIYPKGCSEFICEVLGISSESANSLMGTPTVQVGLPPNYDYSVIEPGDIVGWIIEQGHGHVAVYLGNKRFADVPGEGKKPRELGRWSDNDLVMKSSRFA